MYSTHSVYNLLSVTFWLNTNSYVSLSYVMYAQVQHNKEEMLSHYEPVIKQKLCNISLRTTTNHKCVCNHLKLS